MCGICCNTGFTHLLRTSFETLVLYFPQSYCITLYKTAKHIYILRQNSKTMNFQIFEMSCTAAQHRVLYEPNSGEKYDCIRFFDTSAQCPVLAHSPLLWLDQDILVKYFDQSQSDFLSQSLNTPQMQRHVNIYMVSILILQCMENQNRGLS